MSDVSIDQGAQQRALWLSTIAFTACFAVWMIFAIIGIQIKADLGLSETQFGLLVGNAGPDRIADPPGPWRLDRPIWRAARLHSGHAGGGAGDLPAHFRPYLSAIPARGAGRRHFRRLFRGRRRLCLALVFSGQAGRWRSAFSAPAMSAPRSPNSPRPSSWWRWAGRAWPMSGRAGLAIMAVGLLPEHQGRSGGGRNAASRREKPTGFWARDGAAEECPGLALLALLFLSSSAASSRCPCGCRIT